MVDFCVAVMLYQESTHHFLKNELLEGIAFRSSPGRSAYYIEQKEGAGYSVTVPWPSCVIIEELLQSEPLT